MIHIDSQEEYKIVAQALELAIEEQKRKLRIARLSTLSSVMIPILERKLEATLKAREEMMYT